LKKRVLFICTHNSARSQIAEGILKSLYSDVFEVFSGGTNPTELNTYAIKVMEELGIDISGQYSKSIGEFRGEVFDYVVTVCDTAKETCPFFPEGMIHLHWSFPDPSKVTGTEEEILQAFRWIRDEIKEHIEKSFGQILTKKDEK